jgi:thioredoxin reductase (NADPH)
VVADFHPGACLACKRESAFARSNSMHCLIVGAGPAGLTAALYLRRFRRDVMLLDDGRSRALQIERSRNVPGFPGGIGGPDLLRRLCRQLAEFGGSVTTGTVHSLKSAGRAGFTLESSAGTLSAPAVLLATGVADRKPLELPGYDALRHRGQLRQCPVCDGYEHRDARIAVLGNASHAAREALFLRQFSKRILLVSHLAPEPLPQSLLAALAEAGIRRVGARLTHLCGGAAEAGPALLRFDGADSEAVDVVYSALGVEPRASLVAELPLQYDELGALVADGHGRTKVPGLFAAGDVVSGLDQIAVAAAQGAVAATAIHNMLTPKALDDTPVPSRST